MAILLRGRKYHYRFRQDGKNYSGACLGCEVPPDASPKIIASIEKKALEYEAAVRERARETSEEIKSEEENIRKNKTVRALLENYRFELSGGRPIPLADAYPLAAAKPSKRQSLSRYSGQRRQYWNDFAAFMTANFPDVADLAAVRRSHCEAYVKHLSDHGRFVKEVKFALHRKRRVKTVSYIRDYRLAPKTVKAIVTVCKWVFSRLAEDAGIVADPWRDVILPAANPVDREVFSPHELRLIWGALQSNDFCRPLFIIAANSGLTEGDICCMKWNEFDWASGYLRTSRRKTGVRITLPLLPELVEYLRTLPRTGEYVLPEHAALYLRSPASVSERVKTFLHSLGIVTTVEVPGRRKVSIKDLHSMRHVFCYRAKRAGIPESVIMKFVGHAVLAMTQHYASHDTDEELRQEIKKLPPLFVGKAGAPEDRSAKARQQLAELAFSLPAETVQRMLALLQAPAAALPV